MPGRILPLITDQIYHIFNRGIDRRPTFTNRLEYKRARESIKFYRVSNPSIRLSKFLRLEEKRQSEVIYLLQKSKKLVEIACYCFMPNHFHLILKQKAHHGISKFLSNFQNSYTRYFNTRHKRDGSLFMDQFKAVRVETDEQLLHLSRYVHLNPHTGYTVKSLFELKRYEWSSFQTYLNKTSDFVETNLVLSFFRNINEYEKFVFGRADYQRDLKKIEHLLIE
ncbi:hypothetical protein A2960_03040 [Candidatus Gottesmanbacteria bacterium RIFCSPLOWO2_01_FULL_39_12b]|uniref:Transposase IS200-like domain-containing protein n=1 Tax=Candidatus Gottesmanbacteria bacterium RIFCSPLOWO2_01_FULL_39_12b TaxID=1798388 RepID=A0A1F6AQX9_9BACT|nr:MAG: hypothetical protein A2960_03040 [Candidatus Gottesmanbacteria bacterium RIFCSPLOWO2_01_FULL_39_12b]